MPRAIALFAKVPHPGQVKTRLCPPLTPGQAAGFHQACIQDIWENLQTLDRTSLFVYTDADTEHFAPLKANVRQQKGQDLGERMYHCFKDLETQGFGSTLIIGADSPNLPTEYLEQALANLESRDAVLGPTDDGGYYAVGCRRPMPGMFDDIAWSTPQTLSQTETNLAALGFSIHRLPTWYDVDTIAELKRLACEPSLPAHVSRWVHDNRALFAL